MKYKMQQRVPYQVPSVVFMRQVFYLGNILIEWNFIRRIIKAILFLVDATLTGKSIVW